MQTTKSPPWWTIKRTHRPSQTAFFVPKRGSMRTLGQADIKFMEAAFRESQMTLFDRVSLVASAPVLAILFMILAFSIVGNMDMEDQERIEAEKIAYCQQHSQLPYCSRVPISRKWRD